MSDTFREPLFEWNPEKELASRERHGVGFELAQTVFEDPDVLLQQGD